MTATTFDTTIDQGADWYINFYYKDSAGAAINITGYSAAMQLRSEAASTTAALTLGTSAGGIAITGASGLVAVHATAEQTASVAAGTYVYDLEITSGAGIVTRLTQGNILVTPQVTRV
jgi:hypothetical protein